MRRRRGRGKERGEEVREGDECEGGGEEGKRGGEGERGGEVVEIKGNVDNSFKNGKVILIDEREEEE